MNIQNLIVNKKKFNSNKYIYKIFPSIIKKEGFWKLYCKKIGIEEEELDRCYAAIRKYSVACYSEFNKFLTGKDNNPSLETLIYIKALDKAIELWNRCLLYTDDFSFHTNRKFGLTKEEYDRLLPIWKEKGYIDYKGFISTSITETFDFNKKSYPIYINMNIMVNSLSKGIFLRNLGEVPKENEFLIKRGEPIYIEEIKENNDCINIKGRTI